MSQSTDAILAFGFDLGEELPEKLVAAGRESDDEDDGEGFQWEMVAASLAGISPPADEWSDATKPQWHAFWDACRAAEAAHPLTLIGHCSGDYPMRFLAVNGTEMRANRGSPTAIKTPPISPASIEAMRSFCEQFDIEWQEPEWHIFSMWN